MREPARVWGGWEGRKTRRVSVTKSAGEPPTRLRQIASSLAAGRVLHLQCRIPTTSLKEKHSTPEPKLRRLLGAGRPGSQERQGSSFGAISQEPNSTRNTLAAQSDLKSSPTLLSQFVQGCLCPLPAGAGAGPLVVQIIFPILL